MKKIIILGMLAISMFNTFAMDHSKCISLPKEIWIIILIETKLIGSYTLPNLRRAIHGLSIFSRISKLHYSIVSLSLIRHLNIKKEKKLEIILKDFYLLRKNEIIQAIKEKLKDQFNKMFAFTCFDSSFNWFTDINSQDPEHGWTPLILAIFCKNKELVELMIKNGADLDIEGKDKITVLRHAIIRDNKIFELLLSNGATSKRLYS